VPKSLIISPHADDETLGCGGYMAANPGCHVVLMAKHSNDRVEEFIESSKVLKFTYTLLDLPDGYMYMMPIPDVAQKIKRISEQDDYRNAFVCYPSIHQDHQFTHNVSLIGLRRFPGDVLEYEYPEGSSYYTRMIPTSYFAMNDEIMNTKIEAMRRYKSQICDNRDEQSLVGLASIRGLENLSSYAEAYRLIKGRLYS